MIALTGLLAVALAVVHVFAGKLRFLEGVPRSRWLSAAGGISVAYVFVHVLPELAAGQESVQAAVGEELAFLEHHVYLVALAGLMVFYGLERMAKESRDRGGEPDEAAATPPAVFWVHITSFAIYCGLVGYLLVHREQHGTRSLLLFFAAMATHFLVNDYGLRRHHKDRYRRIGRWTLAVAVVAGWAVGVVTEIRPAPLAVLFALLAGGVVLNVLKEELPEERRSRFWAFAAGAIGYAALLILT